MHLDELEITSSILVKPTVPIAFPFLHLLNSYLLLGARSVLMYYQAGSVTTLGASPAKDKCRCLSV